MNDCTNRYIDDLMSMIDRCTFVYKDINRYIISGVYRHGCTIRWKDVIITKDRSCSPCPQKNVSLEGPTIFLPALTS